MLEDILRNWDSSVLDKYFTNVEDCMVKLLSDADEKTRSFARKSFFALKDRLVMQHSHDPNSVLPQFSGHKKIILPRDHGINPKQ